MVKVRIKPVRSARWHTGNIHQLWRNTRSRRFDLAIAPLHRFLRYCALLRAIGTQFDCDDSTTHFDTCVFFLRGGYFVFAFLNTTRQLLLRAAIFAGLSHGRKPEIEFGRFVKGLRRWALSTNKGEICLLIADEVESGSGIGRTCRILKKSMNGWNRTSKCDMRVKVYAIRRDSSARMSDDLRQTVKKWSGEHFARGGVLRVAIQYFVGFLPGYDNDLLCGLKVKSKNWEPVEKYQVVKRTGGRVVLHCETTGNQVFEAWIGRGCLVEFLASCAREWSGNFKGSLSTNLSSNINSNGCRECKRLYAEAMGKGTNTR